MIKKMSEYNRNRRETPEEHAARNAQYEEGMKRAVASGFDINKWKCPISLKVTYPSPFYTPLCVTPERYEAKPDYPEEGFFRKYRVLFLVIFIFIVLAAFVYFKNRKQK